MKDKMSFTERFEKIQIERALLDVARNLLVNGCSLEFVVKNTGLSLEKIKKVHRGLIRKEGIEVTGQT